MNSISGLGSSDPGIRNAIFYPITKVVEVNGFPQQMYLAEVKAVCLPRFL